MLKIRHYITFLCVLSMNFSALYGDFNISSFFRAQQPQKHNSGTADTHTSRFFSENKLLWLSGLLLCAGVYIASDYGLYMSEAQEKEHEQKIQEKNYKKESMRRLYRNMHGGKNGREAPASDCIANLREAITRQDNQLRSERKRLNSEYWELSQSHIPSKISLKALREMVEKRRKFDARLSRDNNAQNVIGQGIYLAEKCPEFREFVQADAQKNVPGASIQILTHGALGVASYRIFLRRYELHHYFGLPWDTTVV